MRLFNEENDSLYLSKDQWRKIFLATSIMTIVLYIVAMICSSLGSKQFILNYQNEHMDNIESFLRTNKIYGLVNIAFLTLEFEVIVSFILRKIPNVLYTLAFYGVGVLCAYFMDTTLAFSLFPFVFYLSMPIIEQIRDNRKVAPKKHWSWKQYLFCLIRLAIATGISFLLQAFIVIIKNGYYDNLNRKITLSAQFVYEIEYLIALLIILYTIHLFMVREKGDRLWATDKVLGGYSQTSKMQSQKSKPKNLSKAQRKKIKLFYLKLYLIQIAGFSILMILPFLCSKVLEFLMMYLAFAIARAILGFKYSLHFKKEVICISVGVIVFGILTLAVPFFYVNVIFALVLGVGLAILLHLSYKYKGLFIFAKIAKPDKFALLYVFFDEDLSETHVKSICFHKNLSTEQIYIIWDYVQGLKISYLADKYNYSKRMFIYKLDEAIDKLIH